MGTHVVCIGVPIKSRLERKLGDSRGIPESGAPSTYQLPEGDHPEGDQPTCIMGFLENPHRYWKSCIDESEVRIKPS